MGTSHDARLMPAKYVRPYSRGEALAISVPAGETRVLKHFRNVCPMGCSCRTFRELKKAPASAYRGFKWLSSLGDV
jgi:hypothetical protein